MKKPTFLIHYNYQINSSPSKLLMIADCKVNQGFVNVLCNRLNTNADLLYIDTSRETRKNVVARHFSYLILAKQAFLIENKYDNIVFWQQFIGLYWTLFSYPKRGTKIRTFLLPLIYKSRKGIIGKLYRLLFSFTLSNSVLRGAICYSSKELKYYQGIFSKCKSKIFFVPYGQVSEIKSKSIAIAAEIPYFFSGGTSNRDYSTLMSVALKIKYNFVVACTRKDVAGMNVPDNIRIFYDAYGEKFDLLMKSSYAVVLTLKNPDISSGQIVLLKAMEIGKPIVATRSAGTQDYVDETCAFLVEPQNTEELQRVLKFIIENPEEAQNRTIRAKRKYQENFTIRRFASSVAEAMSKVTEVKLKVHEH